MKRDILKLMVETVKFLGIILIIACGVWGLINYILM